MQKSAAAHSEAQLGLSVSVAKCIITAAAMAIKPPEGAWNRLSQVKVRFALQG